MFIASIVSNPQDNCYRNLIDLAFEICDEFILVIRNDIAVSSNVNLVLDKLHYSLKEIKEQFEWPGTRCFGESPALVYYYNTDNHAKEILKQVSTSLHSWIHPDLPKDLCFIKNNQPWLINTCHESESEIVTNNKEEINKVLEIADLEVRIRPI